MKGWLGRLLCWHDYDQITEWVSYECGYDTKIYALFICKKCGKPILKILKRIRRSKGTYISPNMFKEV